MSGSDERRRHGTIGHWYLLSGSRAVLAAVIVLGVFVLTLTLSETTLIDVGPSSRVAPMLRSGVLAGLLTLITVALSLNQLVLSRVLGAPAELTGKLDENLEFRRRVEDLAGEPSSPNDPAAFLVLIAETLQERVAALRRAVEEASGDAEESDLAAEIESYADDLASYAEHLREAEGTDNTVDTLLVIFGSEYATHITETRRLERAHGDRLAEEALEELDAILELLKAVATVRQFFKTLAIQQDLARLSRRLIYLGLLAVLAAYYLTLVYREVPSTTIPVSSLSLVASAGTAIVFSPIALLLSYLLRVGTVSLYTVSVGTFVPPEEQAGGP
ncbi:hypothetical protein [Halegenticoccus tardaugens]|uniref:hypothetical protein n=1 Tax=Halegenticoccus tardaugens TaxID=2071624 RepID=UPI00100C3127|nr:hypothetical protein [Halegenticoccus tardaugens]